jgi:hypothetical protein
VATLAESQSTRLGINAMPEAPRYVRSNRLRHTNLWRRWTGSDNDNLRTERLSQSRRTGSNPRFLFDYTDGGKETGIQHSLAGGSYEVVLTEPIGWIVNIRHISGTPGRRAGEGEVPLLHATNQEGQAAVRRSYRWLEKTRSPLILPASCL